MDTSQAMVAALERRLLLSYYHLNERFGNTGFASANLPEAVEAEASELTELSAGGFQIVGTADFGRFAGQDRHIVLAQFTARAALNTQWGTNGVQTSIEVDSLFDSICDPNGTTWVLGQRDSATFVARYTAAGVLDPSFSGDGIAELSFPGSHGLLSPTAIAPGTGGGVVVLGNLDGGTSEILLARFTSAGSLDATFGSGGIAALSGSSLTVVRGLDIDDAGRTIVVGSEGANTFVQRVTSAGNADATFGTSGIAHFPQFPAEISIVHALADGRLLVNAGYDDIARITTVGTLDTSFGDGGTARLAGGVQINQSKFFVNQVGTITVLSLYGASRFLADGTPDPDFGIAGKLLYDFSGLQAEITANSVTLASNGDILLGGSLDNPAALKIARFVPQADVYLDVHGRLFVVGTDAADTLDITQAAGEVRVTRNAVLSTFTQGDVTAIQMEAGAGDDAMTYSSSIAATIVGGSGNDTISAGGAAVSVLASEGDDSVVTGDGADTIDAGAGDNFVFAAAGDDRISAADGHDTLLGGEGNDSIFSYDRAGGANADSIDGGAGDDFLRCGGNGVRIFGRAGNDYLEGAGGDEVLYGDDGNDSLHGGDGNNVLFGGTGNDFLKCGLGDDSLWGEAGYDSLKGGAGNDFLHGGNGKDRMWGQQGNDRLYGSGNNDQLDGGPGADLLEGRDGNDKLSSEDGDIDTVDGGAGGDTSLGNDAGDILTSIEASA